jgi:integrase
MGILAECPICHQKQSLKNKKCKCGLNLDTAKKSKKVRYWIKFRLPNGKQRTEAVGAMKGLNAFSKEDAKTAMAKRRTQKKENRILDILPETKKTFSELSEWYLNLDKIKALAYHKTLQSEMNQFIKVFGDTVVSDLKPIDLEDYQVKRSKQGLSKSYIDKQIEAARTMVTKALDNDEISGDCLKPFRKIKKLCKKGSNKRDRILTSQEYESILINLPAHSQGPFVMAYWTGMRQGEVLKLTWEKVDLKNRMIRLKAEDVKESMPKSIPISKTLRSILMQIPERGRKGIVFKYAGKPIKDIRDGLKTACQKSDIPYGRFTENGFIFHDLRHTFTTNARRAGLHKNVVMAIQGHSTGNSQGSGADMNRWYDVIEDSDLIKGIDQLESYLKNGHQMVTKRGKRRPVSAVTI